MRIVSYNVNGIRSALNKGFINWLKTDPADIICLQEIKAGREDVNLSKIEELGFDSYWFSAQKKGYSGVACLTKMKAGKVVYGCNIEQSDFEGRVLRVDIGDTTIINAYYPSGTTGEERQTYKYKWLDEFLAFLNELRATRERIIVCGDYNIAHHPIDIHDPKGNKKTSGFLPEERAWMDKFLSHGFIDSFRYLNPETPHCYSWWSTRFPAVRTQNKGWRIDYICMTENLRERLAEARIFPDVKHSDHCPVYADFR